MSSSYAGFGVDVGVSREFIEARNSGGLMNLGPKWVTKHISKKITGLLLKNYKVCKRELILTKGKSVKKTFATRCHILNLKYAPPVQNPQLDLRGPISVE